MHPLRNPHGGPAGGTPPGDGLPVSAVRGQRARDIVFNEMLAELRHAYETNTAVVSRIGGQIINNVLEVATYIIPAEGWVSGRYKVAAGCIEVENLGTHEMAVIPRDNSGDGTPPNKGVGLRIVPANSCRVVSLAAHQWTIFGFVGDRVSVQVFTAGAAPGRGLGSVNSGGA